mgnify:FL=1
MIEIAGGIVLAVFALIAIAILFWFGLWLLVIVLSSLVYTISPILIGTGIWLLSIDRWQDKGILMIIVGTAIGVFLLKVYIDDLKDKRRGRERREGDREASRAAAD